MTGADPPSDAPVINIEGERVALGPYHAGILPLYARWTNDFATARNLDPLPRPMTTEALEALLAEILKDERQIWFIIYERDSSTGSGHAPRPIGFCGLTDVDHHHRTAEYAITIGEPDARGKGYGSEATRLTLDYAFTALGLHNVILRVFAYNAAGIRAYQKAGFREIGRRTHSRLMGGRFWDTVYMQALSTGFESPVLARIFVPDAPR
jgi:RimJ/RimL family protein N-acetyltransferase